MAGNGILGGGALGLTAALRLAQRGEHVVLFEREGVPGGLAAGYPVGTSSLEKFYHHLFRSDRHAIGLIEELGLGERLMWPRPNTSTLLGGRRHQLDSPLSLLRFTPLPLLDRLRLGLALAYLKFEPNYTRLEKVTASAWLQRWAGMRAYETVWKPLLTSKFGSFHDKITASWFWARIHYRSSSLGYLRGGFQQLYDALVAEIRRLGGEVHLATTVEGVDVLPDGTFCVRTSSGEFSFDRVISTLPTPLLARLTPALSHEYAERYGREEHLGAQVVVLTLDRPLTDTYWLNINDPGFPFMALVEHTNYMPPEDYGGRHLVYLGNYLPMNHELFQAPEADVVARFLPSLTRINPEFKPEWVQETRLFRAPFAQPIVDVGYRDRLPPVSTPIPNLYSATMAHVYPQDRGQNYSIKLADDLVRSLPPLGTTSR